MIDPHVIAIVVTKRPWLAERVCQTLTRQSRPQRHVVVVSACADYPIATLQRSLSAELVFAAPDMKIGALRNLGIEHALRSASDDALLCMVDDDDFYSDDYLEAIIAAWRAHPTALIVGMASFAVIYTGADGQIPEVGPEQGCPIAGGRVRTVAGATISIPAHAWRRCREIRYPNLAIGEDYALQLHLSRLYDRPTAGARGGRFVAVRYSDPAHAHTSPNPPAIHEIHAPASVVGVRSARR